MEFFIDDKETEEKFQEIFKKIQLLRNGETHHEMKKFGLNYPKALGATIVNLREIAAEYTPNHLLAHKLWTKDFRESKIVATLLEEPDQVSPEQLERWFTQMDSNELLEQASMNLFVNLPEIQNTLPIWMSCGDQKKQLCAIMVAGRLAMKQNDGNDEVFLNFIDLLPVEIEDSYLKNQVKRSLGKIVRLNKNLADKVTKLVMDLKEKDQNWMDIWDDLKYELHL